MAITPQSLTLTSRLILGLSLLLSACSFTPSTTQAPGLIRKAFSPTWGPDGQQVAFLYRIRPEGTQEVKDSLYTILSNGIDLVKVRSLSPARFKSVDWSPSGNFFLLTTEDTQEIYITENNGQNLERLTEGDQVSWHPFEQKFVSTFDNQCETIDRVGGRQCQRQIRLFDLATRTHVALSLDLPREVIAPTWSADGLKVSWLTTSTEKSKDLSRRLLELHSFNIANEDHQIIEIQPTELAFNNAEWSLDRNILAFNYLSRIQLFFFNQPRSFEITQGIEPALSNDNTRLLYTNLIGENRGDIALFDRSDNSIRTIISHRQLPNK